MRYFEHRARPNSERGIVGGAARIRKCVGRLITRGGAGDSYDARMMRRPLTAILAAAALVGCTVTNSTKPPAAPAATPAPTAPSAPSAALAPASLPAILCDLTGAQSPLGTQAEQGARLALADATGGSLPAAQSLDTASTAGIAASQARAAVVHHPMGIGFTDSDLALAGVPVFIESGKPFIVVGATDPGLPERCGPGTFLACFGDDAQGVAAAEFGAARFGKRAAIVFDSRRTYPRTLAGYFRTHLGTALEGSAVVEFDLASTAPPAIAPHLVGMRAEIDFVYLALEPESIAPCLRAVRAALPDVPVVGGDAFDFDGALQLDGKPVDRVWFTTHAWLGEGATPEAREFTAAFVRAYRTQPTAFAALGYDAARLAVDARRRAGSDSPEAIAAALMATVDFRGVSGRMSFAAGPVPRKDVWVVAIAAGTRALAERRPAFSRP